MPNEPILQARDGAIITVTLNNPNKLNALTCAMWRRLGELMRERGWRLLDADCVLVLELPKVSPYRDEMRRVMAHALGVDAERIGVKATTTEGLGFAGREEGVAAQAIVLLERVSP